MIPQGYVKGGQFIATSATARYADEHCIVLELDASPDGTIMQAGARQNQRDVNHSIIPSENTKIASGVSKTMLGGGTEALQQRDKLAACLPAAVPGCEVSELPKRSIATPATLRLSCCQAVSGPGEPCLRAKPSRSARGTRAAS